MWLLDARELLLVVYGFLDARELLLVARVGKRWHEPAFAPALWRELRMCCDERWAAHAEELLCATPALIVSPPLGARLALLSLRDCELHTAEVLEPCVTLTDLDLSGCSGCVGAALGAALRNCPASLKSLTVRNVPGDALNVDEFRAAWVAPHTGLETLDIRGSFGDGGAHMAAAIESVSAWQPLALDFLPTACPNLITLRLGWRSEPRGPVSVSRQILSVSGVLLHGGANPLAALLPTAQAWQTEYRGLFRTGRAWPVRELSLPGCQLLHPTALLRAVRSCPTGGAATVGHLWKLDLCCCAAVTADALSPVLAHCGELRHLNIRATAAGGCIPALAAHCPQLVFLNASCTAITPDHIRALADGCPRLLTLDVCYPSVDEMAQAADGMDSILHFATKLPQLRMLGLGGFLNLTDAALHALLPKLRKLTHLAVGGCSALSPTALDIVCRDANQLTKFNAHQIRVASSDTIARFLLHMPQCKAVDFDGVTVQEQLNFVGREYLALLKSTHPYDYDDEAGEGSSMDE